MKSIREHRDLIVPWRDFHGVSQWIPAAIMGASAIAGSAISAANQPKGPGGSGGGAPQPLPFTELGSDPGSVGKQYTDRVMGYLGTPGAAMQPREIAPWNAEGIFQGASGLAEDYDPTSTALGGRIRNIGATSTVMPAAQTAMVDTLGRQGVFDPYDPITQSQIQASTRPIFTQRDKDLSTLRAQAATAGQGAGFGSRYGLGAADLMTGANLGAADVTANILGAERARIEKQEQDYRLGALGLAPGLEEARYLGPKYEADAARVDILRRGQQTEAARIAATIAQEKRAAEQEELDRVYLAERATEERDLERQKAFTDSIRTMLSGQRGSSPNMYAGGGGPSGYDAFNQTLGNVAALGDAFSKWRTPTKPPTEKPPTKKPPMKKKA